MSKLQEIEDDLSVSTNWMHVREVVGALIAEVKRLEAEVERLKQRPIPSAQ